MGEVVLKSFTINGRRFTPKTALNLKDEPTLEALRKQGLVGKASEKKK